MEDTDQKPAQKMWRIVIDCTEPIARAVVASLQAMQMVAGDGFDPDTLQMAIDPDPKQPRVLGARAQYKAILPANVSEITKTIQKNLDALGEKTIKGIVYKDIVDATLAGEVITERMITERRHYRTKTVQRSIVELRHGALVESVPIVPAAE